MTVDLGLGQRSTPQGIDFYLCVACVAVVPISKSYYLYLAQAKRTTEEVLYPYPYPTHQPHPQESVLGFSASQKIYTIVVQV